MTFTACGLFCTDCNVVDGGPECTACAFPNYFIDGNGDCTGKHVHRSPTYIYVLYLDMDIDMDTVTKRNTMNEDYISLYKILCLIARYGIK